MEYFNKLPVAWRDAINAVIKDGVGDEYPDMVSSFRESMAKYLNEVVIPNKPTKRWKEEIQESLVDFHAGWKAAVEHLSTDNMALISSWIREHGELTDYSDLEDNDYEAYIVKASDLTGAE